MFEEEALLSQGRDGWRGRVTAADRNTPNDTARLSADKEALERYYRRRIREIERGERREEGTFIPIDEVQRIADEFDATRRS